METISIAFCTICFDNLCQSPTPAVNVNSTVTAVSTSSNTICALECGHVFHRDCIDRWFNVLCQRSDVKKCPHCQANFSALPKVQKIYVSFETSFAFDDLRKSYTKSELDLFNTKRELTVMEAECRELRARLTTSELERSRQPFRSITNMPPARAHNNEVQKTALDLRTSKINVVNLPAPEAPGRRQPIQLPPTITIRRSVSLNRNSGPPRPFIPPRPALPPPDGSMSPRTINTYLRSIVPRRNRPQ